MKNNMLYAIIIYVITMLIIILIKPDFIYDHNKSKFKEFGSSKDKSFLSLGTTAVLLAILTAILFMVFGNSNDDEKTEKETPKVQYIPVPVYQQPPPQYVQPMPQPMPQVIYQQAPVTPQVIPQVTHQVAHHVVPQSLMSPSNLPQSVQSPASPQSVQSTASPQSVQSTASPRSAQSTASPQYSEKN
jgi:hypothetical protein